MIFFIIVFTSIDNSGDNVIAYIRTKLLPIIVRTSIKSETNFWTPSKITESNNDTMRNTLKIYLKFNYSKTKCMVTGQWGNGEQVVGAHIIPRSVNTVEVNRVLGYTSDDINHARNGLLLAKGIEEAFDRMQISFIKTNPLHDKLYMKIWDESVLDNPIWKGSKLTIRNFQNNPLSLGRHNPFKRGLSYHAYRCFLYYASDDKLIENQCIYGSPGNYQFKNDLQLMKEEVYHAIEADNEEDNEI